MADEPITEEQLQLIFYMMLLALLFLKMMVEAYMEKSEPSFGHNTGIIIIVGILMSYAIFQVAQNTDEKEILSNLQFDPSLFFNLILPCIVFPSGYNMRRKKFFRNIKTIMKFGFVGTMICFAIYTAMLYGV